MKPGEKIPLDGVVEEGVSCLNTSNLTGESAPRDVAPGDAVTSGCVNVSGVLRIRVAKSFEQSTVSKILELVEHASGNKARAENFITRFARYYTPAVVIAAACLALIPPLFVGGWSGWIYQALIFLVISCPCALVISVPLSFFGGIGGASKCGVLIKGANYMEALSKVQTVVFDKTGTLTKGSFFVTAVHPNEISEEELLELAAKVECWSGHPIAQSLRAAYKKEIDPSCVTDAEELSGHGVCGTVDGKRVCAGNNKLMQRLGVQWRDCHRSGTVVHVVVDGVYAGHIVIEDCIKDDSADAIRQLRRNGVQKTVMLTGDHKQVGEAVAAALGIDEVHTELLPDEKVQIVERLLSEQKDGKLAFAGDGINDAPVLMRADIGIAMGALGSDAAIEAADVVLMDDRPSKIPVATGLARKTMSIVRQNIVFALGVKLLVLLLGALGYATMWEAVFADVGVSVLAILNAMRTLHTRQ